MIHHNARCLGTIAPNSEIGPFSSVGSGSAIGERTRIGAHVTIGDRVKVGSVIEIADGARIGSDTTIEDRAVVEIGAVVTSGIVLGFNCQIRPGAVVNGDVPPNAIVQGNPARIIGYVDVKRQSGEVVNARTALDGSSSPVVELSVGDTSVWRLPSFEDLRGSLVVGDFESGLPFVPRRMFFVFNVPGEKVRGEHAHKYCAQFLIAVHGALSVVVDDGSRSQEIRLDRPNIGLFLPPKIWGIQYQFTEEAVLGVLASSPYDPDDYIRDYGTYLQFLAAEA